MIYRSVAFILQGDMFAVQGSQSALEQARDMYQGLQINFANHTYMTTTRIPNQMSSTEANFVAVAGQANVAKAIGAIRARLGDHVSAQIQYTTALGLCEQIGDNTELEQVSRQLTKIRTKIRKQKSREQAVCRPTAITKEDCSCRKQNAMQASTKSDTYTLAREEIVELANMMSQHKVLKFYARIQQEHVVETNEGNYRICRIC